MCHFALGNYYNWHMLRRLTLNKKKCQTVIRLALAVKCLSAKKMKNQDHKCIIVQLAYFAKKSR